MNWHWLNLIVHLAPIVMSVIPGAAPLAPIVAVAIQRAESMPGATGAQKLALAQQLVVEGATAANVLAGHTVIEPMLAQSVAAEAISTVVDTANVIHRAHAPAAAA